MEILYNGERLAMYEKRAQNGRKLAYLAQAADLKHRKLGKTLIVASFYRGEDRIPCIRVAGKWLQEFGFELGDEVTLVVEQGRIVIVRKEVQGNAHALV